MWATGHYSEGSLVPKVSQILNLTPTFTWHGGDLRNKETLNRNCLTVPRCRLSTYGCRAFDYAGPTVWNSLPDELRNSDSFDGS